MPFRFQNLSASPASSQFMPSVTYAGEFHYATGGVARAVRELPTALIAIADGQEFIRLGLCSLLDKLGCSVIGNSESVSELLATEVPKGTLLIIDPWSSAISEDKSWRNLVETGYSVLIYTTGPLTTARKKALSSPSPKGCVLKSEPVGVLLEAISSINCGNSYFSSASNNGRDQSLRLTTREMQIAKLLAQGRVNKEIAGSLGLSVRTVETHRINLRRKLGIDNISELTRLLLDEGMA